MKFDLKPFIAFAILWSLTALLFFFLFGCSPILRHNRLVKKFPYVHTADTLVIRDTVRFMEVHTDSMFYYNQKDTVIINKENLQIKYFYNNDSVYIDGRCKEVVKVVEHKVPVYKNNTDWLAMFKQFYWVLFGLVFLYLLYRIFVKR